ncbi:MotE family protein [Rhodovulum sp. FJ3]|uniref:MotE family protein n=1 Tax=Rhodovulum sp. FJ3 TaxID=3079053 RepID=UPI00293DFFAA|nr:hypothetical protein [Rhodovulum sp. FJ3]MDV4169803.1 hypothetical protein [Rhodovulum sp. FJ3]
MKTRTYVLPVVILLLVASVGTRFGGSAAAALAKGAETLTQSHDSHTPAPDVAALLEALKTREMAVVEREAALDERHAQLEQVEQDLRAQLDELRQAEVALRATIAQADSAAEDDLGRLTAVYENMKPKDAADLFSTMDADFAAGFVARMRPEIAADIMAGLPPENAYAISAILAGRNQNAGQ